MSSPPDQPTRPTDLAPSSQGEVGGDTSGQPPEDASAPPAALYERLRQGNPTGGDDLFGELYQELHSLARAGMARQNASHTLQPTALVNEAYLKLCRGGAWASRAEFLRLASTAMRHILVDHARRKNRRKRSPQPEDLKLTELASQFEDRAIDLLSLDDALKGLSERDPSLVQLVELRFFCGCAVGEAAEVLGISERQANRWWNVARAVLRQQIDGS